GRRAGLTDAEAQDVVQETLLNICHKIGQFRYDPERGSFKGWLLKTTSWRITDRLRKRERERTEPLEGVSRLPESEEVNLAASWETDWERNLLEAAMQRVKKQIAPKQFQIFDLAMVKHWSTDRIAQTLSVSPGYVYLTKHRVSAKVRREAK